MRITLLSCVVLFAVGCSGSDDKPSCDLAHRIGTYVAHFTERANGNCGPLTDQVVKIDNAAALPPGCTKDLADDASADRCRWDRNYTCVAKDGSSVKIQATTTEHDSGKTLTGVETTTLFDADGNVLCTSAYDVVFDRQ